jgi:hypothetical protein
VRGVDVRWINVCGSRRGFHGHDGKDATK